LTTGLELQRLGIVMESEPGNPNEVEGVLNPAAARGHCERGSKTVNGGEPVRQAMTRVGRDPRLHLPR